MKKTIIFIALSVLLIIGCSPQNGGASSTSTAEVSSNDKLLNSSQIDSYVLSSSSTPLSLSDKALRQSLPYKNGEIDFEKIALGYNLIYSFFDNYNNDFDFSEAFYIVFTYGIYSFQGNVKQEIEPYFNHTEYNITLPARAVDDYILSKFDVVVDRSLISTYDPEDGAYFIELFTGEYYYETEIVSYEQLPNGYYEVIVKTTHDIMDDQKQVDQYVQKFVIDCSNDDYKYISVNLISSEMVDVGSIKAN